MAPHRGSRAAALKSHYWDDCEALPARDRARLSEMALLEHWGFAVHQARQILRHHIRPIIAIGGMIATMRLPASYLEWSGPYLSGMREVIAGIDRRKTPEFLTNMSLQS